MAATASRWNTHLRVLCDARILNIFEGAAEIQAQVIARRLLEQAN
jgi:(2S)-methylsuccinyl-CoA dehydrogenase